MTQQRIPRRGRSRQRRYSEAEVIQGLAALQACGGILAEAERMTGIPATTLTLWRDTAHVLPAEAVHEFDILREGFRQLAGGALAHANNPEVLKEASALQAATIAGIATDKVMALDRAKASGLAGNLTPDQKRRVLADLLLEAVRSDATEVTTLPLEP